MPVQLEPDTLAKAAAHADQVRREVAKVFIGTPLIVDLLLCSLVARGHVLLEGVPGVAKTTLAKAFAETLSCSFRRIQFTPDLLPSDITGTYVLDQRRSEFVLRKGPIFAQVLLGDEINRAPPKTQSALLEAMQERQVTIDGDTLGLSPPFVVLATQNPIEHAGTYPLPEAELDRFLLKAAMGYPEPEAERLMLKTYSRPRQPVARVLAPSDVLGLQELADQVHVDDELYDYVLGLVRYTRQHALVALGASPRAALSLVHAARALALLAGRDFTLPDDIKRLAPAVLTHRILMTSQAELDHITAQAVVTEALARVPWRKREG